MDWYSVSSDVSIALERCDKEGAEQIGRAFNLPVSLCSNLHLLSGAFGNAQNNEIADTSSQNEFPPYSGSVSQYDAALYGWISLKLQ